MKVSEAFLAEVNDLDPDNKYSRINPKLVARHRTHTYHSNKWEYLSSRQVYTDSEYHSVCTKTDRYFKHQIETLMNLLRGHKRGAGSRAKSMEKEHIKLYSSDGSTPTRDFSSGRGDRRARSRPIERTHMTTSPFSTKLRRQLGHESLFDQNKNAGNYYTEASPSFSPLKEKFKSEFGSLEGFKSISSDEFLRSARRGRSGRDQEIETMRTEIVMQPDQGYDSLRGSHNKKIRRSRRDRENKNHDMTFSNKDDYSSTPSHSMGDTEREYISTKESPKVPHLDELIRDRKIGRDGYASSGTPVDADNEKYHSRLFNTPKKEATPPTKSSKGNEYIQQVLDIRFAASPKDNEKTGVFRSPIRPSRSINKKKTAENDVSEENKQGNTGSEKRKFSESKDENRKAFLTENSSYGSLVNYSSQERLPGIKRDMVLKSDRSSEKGLETQSGRVTEREEIGPWARSSEEQGGSMSSDNRTDSENKGGLVMNMEERKSERQTPRENNKRSSLSNSEDLREKLSEEEQRLRRGSTERRKLSDNKSDRKNEEYIGPDKLIEEINKAAIESQDNNTFEIKNMMNKGLWNIEEDASKELSRFSDPEHVEVSPYGNNEEFKLQEVEVEMEKDQHLQEPININETLKLEETEKLDSFREEIKLNNDFTENITSPNELENNASHSESHNEGTLDIDGIGKNEEELIQEMIKSKNSVALEESNEPAKEEFKEDRQMQKMSEEISFAQIKIEEVKTNENNMQESQEEEHNNIQESKEFSGEEHNNLSLNDQEVVTDKIYSDKDSDLHAQEEEQAKSESIESHINIYENLNKDSENKYMANAHHEGEDFESRDEESIQDKIENLVNESNEENAQVEEEKQDENILSERKYSEKEKIGSEDSEFDQFKQVTEKRKETDYKASDLEENTEREAHFEERVNDSLSGNMDVFIEKRHENQLEEVDEVEKYVEKVNKSTENVEETQENKEENRVNSEMVFQNFDTKEENIDNPSIDSLENKGGEKTEKYEYVETKIEQTAEHGRAWKKQAFSRQQTEKHEMTFCEEFVDNVSNDSLQNISDHKKQSQESRSEIDGAYEEQILEQNSHKEEAEERYNIDSARNKMNEEEEEKIEDDKVETVHNEYVVVEEVDDRVSIEDAKDNLENVERQSDADAIQESNGEILADTMDHLEQEKQSFVKSEIEEEVKIENIEDKKINSARKESDKMERINESQASIEQSSKWEKNESLGEACQQESVLNQDSLKEVMKSGSKRRGRNERKKASNKKEVDEEAEKFVQECIEDEDINLKTKVEEQQDKTDKTLSEKAGLESFTKQENIVEGSTQKDDLHEKQKTSRKGTMESHRSDRKDSLANYSSVKSRGSDSVRSGQENHSLKEEEKSNKRKPTESLSSLPKSQSNLSAKSLSLVENNEQENIHGQMSGIMDNQADFSDVQKSVRKDTFESQRTDRKDDIAQRKESLRKSSSGVKSNSDEHLSEENKKSRSRVSSHVSKSSNKDKIIDSLNNEQNLQSRTSSKNAILTEYKEPEEIKDQILVAMETEHKSPLIGETQKAEISVPVNSLVLDEDDEQQSLEEQKFEFSRGEPLEQEINLDRGQNQEKRKKVYLMPDSFDQVTSTVKSLPKTEKENVMEEDLTWEDIRMIRQIQLQAAIIIQRRFRQFLQEKRAQQAQRAKFYLEKIDPEDLKAFANSLKRNESLSEGIRSFSPKKRKEDMIELMLAFVSSYSVLGRSQTSNRK